MSGVDEKQAKVKPQCASTHVVHGRCFGPLGHPGKHRCADDGEPWVDTPIVATQADLDAYSAAQAAGWPPSMVPKYVSVQPNSPAYRLRRDVNRLIGLVPGNVWNSGGALSSQEALAQLADRVAELERAMAQRPETASRELDDARAAGEAWQRRAQNLESGIRNAIGPMPGYQKLPLIQQLVLRIGRLSNDLDRAVAKQDTPGARSDAKINNMVAGLQRKVQAQAKQIRDLEELRRASVARQPEYRALQQDLAAQAQLTEREHRMRLDAADSARRADANAARWSSRYGQLIGDALHMLRRLNALAGQPDAKDFTRAAASAAVNAVLELRKQDAVKITNLEDDLVGASREIGRLDEVLTGLRVQSQCPHLQLQVVSGRFTSQELRRCVRVNQHDGQHIRSDGEAW